MSVPQSIPALPFDIDAALKSGIAVAQGAKSWSGHDRMSTVGASEVGRCMRSVWYAKNQVPSDANFMQDMGAAERGRAIEDWLVLRLQDAIRHDPAFGGWELVCSGADQVTLVDSPQSATPDGLLVRKHDGLAIYLEIKSQDPRIYETSIATQTAHKCQTIQGMGLVRRKLKPYRPNHAILIYVNTSFVNQYRPFVIPYTDAGDKALRDRAVKIMSRDFTVADPPPAEGLAEGGKECQYCPWRERCTLREAGRLPQNVTKVAPDVAMKLYQLAVMRKELLMREHEAESSKKGVEQEIVDIMSRHDTKRVQDSWGSISIYKAHSPPVPLWEKIEQELGADKLSEFKRPGTPYIRVNVALS